MEYFELNDGNKIPAIGFGVFMIPADGPTYEATLAALKAGYRHIEEATNGEEALQKLSRSHPDIVIIDVWLSKMDGIGVLRNCQNLKFAPDKPPAFIVVSMVSKQSIFIEAANAGADLCLLKPYNIESLCKHFLYFFQHILFLL